MPFAAGGNIDVMGRLAAARLSEAFGQQFVVENRVGGNGIIATEAVARAPPDGYTLLWAQHLRHRHLSRDLQGRATTRSRISAPVSLFGVAPAGADRQSRNSRRKTVAEFVAYVKAQKESSPMPAAAGRAARAIS